MNKVTVQRRYFLLLIILPLLPGALMRDALAAEFSIIAPLAEHSLLLDIAAHDNRLIAVGERGHVLVSANDGGDWRQVRVPTRATLTAIYMLDGRRAWAVGHDAVILRSIDGGDSWQRVFHEPDQERPLLDVWFADEHHGLAVGAYGYYLESSDGGKTWRERTIDEEDYHLNQLAADTDGRLFIAGEAGHVYFSDDDGEHWESLPSPYRGSFFSILAADRHGLFIAGLRGHLYRSEDNGKSWTPLPARTSAMLTDLFDYDRERTVVVGLDGVVIVHTFPDLLNYHFQPDRKGITAVAANSRGELFVVGEGGLARVHIPDPAAGDAP